MDTEIYCTWQLKFVKIDLRSKYREEMTPFYFMYYTCIRLKVLNIKFQFEEKENPLFKRTKYEIFR